MFGQDAYPTFDMKAPALFHSLARNHPLADDNERLAWAQLDEDAAAALRRRWLASSLATLRDRIG